MDDDRFGSYRINLNRNEKSFTKDFEILDENDTVQNIDLNENDIQSPGTMI